MNPVTLDEIRKVIALSDLPDEHLQWILDRSELKVYEDGETILRTGDAADSMFFMVEGRMDFYLDVNGQLVYYYHFTNDEVTGGAGGLLPYSRMKKSPGNSIAVGRVRGLMLHKKYFQELEHLNPDLIQRLIGYMTERARAFATTKMQHEKVSALGRLSAGIAHELNNPASAINRISSDLVKRLNLNYELTEKLLNHNISADQIRSIRSIVNTKKASPKLSVMQKMEKEDELSLWLEQQGIDNRQVAETAAEAGYSPEDLELIKGSVNKEAFNDILEWFENLLSSQRVILDLEEASARISNLVGAIKSHVQMDRTNELQPTDIHIDIDNTLTLLGYKLREKKIKIIKNYCKGLPVVPAYIGELNQVWTNIIDNAIYAMDKNGELTIESTCDSKNVIVKIRDNGTGIPAGIMSRIFDPFFTTKKVGEGTGIGLDLVNRIIKRHKGEIKVHSVPGRTEFTICIPLKQ